MAQNKKDFMAEAAGVFVDKMITPAETSTPTNNNTPKAKPAAKRQQQPQTPTAGAEVKVCYMICEDIERKLRMIACMERIKQKAIVAAALQTYIDDYEKTHGKIK